MKARPTIYKGIQMRSRLEADYAAWLDADEIAWEYEPVVFAGPDGQWLPDFRLVTNAGKRVVYLEVKPTSILDGGGMGAVDRIDAILQQMTVAWLSEPAAILDLVVWEYGASWPRTRITSGRSRAWYVDGESPVLPLWSGMGQWEKVKATSETVLADAGSRLS